MFESQLLIAGWSEYAEGDYDHVLFHLRASAKTSLDEDGCFEFSITTDPSKPGRITTFERWLTAAHHRRHLATDHVEQYRQTVSGIHPLRKSLHRFIVTEGDSL